jgi:hypothetical protein
VVAVAVLALIAIPLSIFAATGGLEREAVTTQSPPAPPQPSPGATGATDWSVGRGFETGGFTIKIVSYQDDIPALSADGSEVSEHGQWILIGIRVRNSTSEEGTFVPDQQTLITETGQTYSNEPASALKHADFKLGTLPIAPGGDQSGYLAFDIPLDARATELRLVGRIGEPSVTVPLG